MPLLDELLLSDCADAVGWVEKEEEEEVVVVVVVGEVDGAETVEVRVMFSRSVAELEAGTESELELAWPEGRVEVNVVWTRLEVVEGVVADAKTMDVSMMESIAAET